MIGCVCILGMINWHLPAGSVPVNTVTGVHTVSALVTGLIASSTLAPVEVCMVTAMENTTDFGLLLNLICGRALRSSVHRRGITTVVPHPEDKLLSSADMVNVTGPIRVTASVAT